MTLQEPPGETTHWTVRARAKTAGIAARSVQRIRATHGLKPHLIKALKLSRRSRFHLHFTPTSAFWLNAVEGFFAQLTRRRPKRGVFKGIADLREAINRFIAEQGQDPKPFVWAADPNRVVEKARRGKQALESIHWGG